MGGRQVGNLTKSLGSLGGSGEGVLGHLGLHLARPANPTTLLKTL